MKISMILSAALLLAALPLCAQQTRKTIYVAPTVVSPVLPASPALERVRVALTGELAARLSATRRFELVDRSVAYEAAADAERGLTDVGAVEMRGAEHNRLTGAENVLVPEITAWHDASASQDGLVRRAVTVTLQTRIVDTTTGGILDTVSVTKSVVQAADAVNAASLETLSERIAADAAADSVSRLTLSLFPASVIDVDGTTVTVNRGAGFFEVGMIVTVFSKSRTVVDPESGESFRIKGSPSGKARITYVENAFSQGELLDGAKAVVGSGIAPDAPVQR